MKKKSGFKTIRNVILSLIIILAVGLDCWGLYIRIYGKDKINSYVFKVGKQTASAIDPVTGEVTTEDRWFAEVNLYDNCFEILFNYFIDDTHSEFYSQGIQFYLSDTSSTDNFSYYMNTNYRYGSSLGILGLGDDDLHLYFNTQNKQPIKDGKNNKVVTETSKEKFWFITTSKQTKITSYYYNILSNKEYPILEVANLASSNNYEDTIYSSNPLDGESYFRIQMDGEPYLMQMKGSNYEYLKANDDFFLTENVEYVREEANWIGNYHTSYYDDISYYRTCDPYYLAEIIYNSCGALDYSSDGIVINFEFGDLFNYFYEGEEIINDQSLCDKVKNYVSNYYQIKVNKFKGKMTSASQSLFNYFKGSQNYNEELAEDSEDAEVFTDYHHGRTILDLTEDYFDISIEPTSSLLQDGQIPTYYIYLSLKENFKNRYASASGYRLRINIDLDNLTFGNAEFKGFITGTFGDYSIYKITTSSVASGELVEIDITQEVLNDV